MNKLERITEILGVPYYWNESSVIYNMDCRIGLELLLKSGIKVDATITSPPYNIGKEYEKILPLRDFINWLTNISKDIHGLTKDDGCYLLNPNFRN